MFLPNEQQPGNVTMALHHQEGSLDHPVNALLPNPDPAGAKKDGQPLPADGREMTRKINEGLHGVQLRYTELAADHGDPCKGRCWFDSSR